MSLWFVPLLLIPSSVPRTVEGAAGQEPLVEFPSAMGPAPGAAQIERGAGQLERARATFTAADRDGDGGLDAREIRAAGIPGLAAASHDVDADGRIVLDEFLVYYRRLLVNARRTVEPELEAAVRSVLAERQRQAERARDSQRQERRLRRSPGSVEEHGEEFPRWVLSRSRQRLDEVQDEMAARPRRAGNGVLQPEGTVAAEALVGEARALRAATGELLEGREQRLAALRQRMEGSAERPSPTVAEGSEPAPAGGTAPPTRPSRPVSPGAPLPGRTLAPVAGGPDRAHAERVERAQDAPTPGPRTAGPRVDAVGADDP